jgi:hypothetical protein
MPGNKVGHGVSAFARTFTSAEFVICQPAFNASVMATQ